MPEVIFAGPAGRLEGRYHPAKQKNAPIAMILHPHPQFHGTMNHQIVYQCYYAFAHRGFSVLRFNFRGVGRSQGSFDRGEGELSDAASALDWLQSYNPNAAPQSDMLRMTFIKLSGSYEPGWGLRLSPLMRYQTGTPYGRRARSSTAAHESRSMSAISKCATTSPSVPRWPVPRGWWPSPIQDRSSFRPPPMTHWPSPRRLDGASSHWGGSTSSGSIPPSTSTNSSATGSGRTSHRCVSTGCHRLSPVTSSAQCRATSCAS